MSNKIEVKRLITACQGLNEVEKTSLRRLLDQDVVSFDSVAINGTLISIPELRLVISDNQGIHYAKLYIFILYALFPLFLTAHYFFFSLSFPCLCQVEPLSHPQVSASNGFRLLF